MSAFAYADGRLCAEGVPLARIAEEVGTPTYVYAAGEMRTRYRAFAQAFRHPVAHPAQADHPQLHQAGASSARFERIPSSSSANESANFCTPSSSSVATTSS